MFDTLMNTVYKSAYTPGPVARSLALAAGAYAGLVIAATIHHELR